MNDRIRVMRLPRRAWPATARAAAVCSSGGSTSSTGSGDSASSPSAVGFSHCMREHGVPNYPDPDSTTRGATTVKEMP
jgi:hypothetical protein